MDIMKLVNFDSESLKKYIMASVLSVTAQGIYSAPQFYVDSDLNKTIFDREIVLSSDISDSNWKNIPYSMDYLDLSNVNQLSEAALDKLSSMTEVKNIFLRNLQLGDQDILKLPQKMEYVDLSYNHITTKSLSTLQERGVKKVKITANIIFSNKDIKGYKMEIIR